MIETERTRRALELATKYHNGQTDKGGEPYINHPIHVAEQMQDETTTIVALLHDTLEDTKLTAGEIEREFGGIISKACQDLTHRQNEPYMNYIERVSQNPIAREVKIADLRHNMDITRLSHVTEKDMIRRQKYMKSLMVLGDMDEEERAALTSMEEILILEQ